MTTKNTSKAVDDNAPEVGEAAEANVPQQKNGEKVAVLKGGGVDGKDAIILSDDDNVPTVMQKIKKLMWNKKVLVGAASAFITVVAVVAIRSMSDSNPMEDDVNIDTEYDEYGNVTSVTVTNKD